jgi:hypothetical protein
MTPLKRNIFYRTQSLYCAPIFHPHEIFVHVIHRAVRALATERNFLSADWVDCKLQSGFAEGFASIFEPFLHSSAACLLVAVGLMFRSEFHMLRFVSDIRRSPFPRILQCRSTLSAYSRVAVWRGRESTRSDEGLW